jgi:hypothetical protein
VNREVSSSAFAVELTTLTPRATTDDNISAPTWCFILFPAAMSVYPFEPDDSYPNSAALRAAAPISDELASLQLGALHFECPASQLICKIPN